MSEGQSLNFLWGIGALVLVVSALSVRRASLAMIVRSLISWAAIAGILYLVLTNWGAINQLFGQVGNRFGIEEQVIEGETVRIGQSPDGHFWARVRLNGFERRMLIDSGATMTALSAETAQAAGITAARGVPVLLTTANGTIQAARGRAETVAIGTLETRDLGVVISPAFGRFDVIGMNFLSRLGSWRVEGRTLILEPKRQTGSVDTIEP